MTTLVIERAGPLTTIQDRGRPGMLAHGVSASGPMDRTGFTMAGAVIERYVDDAKEPHRALGAAIECGSLGLTFRIEGGPVVIGLGGGGFTATVNGQPRDWPGALAAQDGDQIDIRTGPAGNYGYVRFDREIDVPPVLGSRATNATVGLGGFGGRALATGDRIGLVASDGPPGAVPPNADSARGEGPIRMMWGLHADLFPAPVRAHFLAQPFTITARMDRMGVRLNDTAGVFADQRVLTLVSDAVVAGDIQILGDGTPIVLMRDHQPTGGYPRIGTIIGADIDRFAQTRPGVQIEFQSVTIDNARRALFERRGL